MATLLVSFLLYFSTLIFFQWRSCFWCKRVWYGVYEL